ncbi:hypothetical protein GCM10008171_01530 [Methylopila jiangsuensis]|uniref:Uncharacterized protein n=1 Tax=Methylopila jiangsuensis TaxID=586230 RepID=A0A9W6JFI6_9HYPH|nr:hypothetical protein [Methylopila jiangsuensis]MDR6287320.1 hypothetical protein [Methylopila jiangsuensis]GLK74900.1 hypothetical protein GCM10008171_01530 [Methylopila jiangsuensis]
MIPAAAWLGIGFAAFVAAIAAWLRVAERPSPVAAPVAVKPDVARVIEVVAYYELGGRRCLCCERPSARAGSMTWRHTAGRTSLIACGRSIAG